MYVLVDSCLVFSSPVNTENRCCFPFPIYFSGANESGIIPGFIIKGNLRPGRRYPPKGEGLAVATEFVLTKDIDNHK